MRRIDTAVVRSAASWCVVLGLASGCSKLADDCGRTLTCPNTVRDASVLPNAPSPTNGSDVVEPGPGAPSDAGPAPPVVEAGSDAAVPFPTLLDTPCSAPSPITCDGQAQKLSLICAGGVWNVWDTCLADENCDGDTGACAPILPQCAEGITRFCVGRELRECGPDLVSATTAETCPVGCGDVEPVRCTVATQVVNGFGHACALLDTGGVRCWGNNTDGQLGYGRSDSAVGDDELPSSLPLVDVGGKASQLTAGRSHTCALLEGGDVRCWGSNAWGQLGYGHTRTIGLARAPGAEPVVNVGARVLQIAAGGNTTCALLDGGSVRCWGSNSGMYGNATTATVGDDEAPAATSGFVGIGDEAKQIAVSDSHACALLESGEVRCWGSNAFGAVGASLDQFVVNAGIIGDDELPSDVPVLAIRSSTEAQFLIERIAVGERHSCVLFTNGSVRCWGDARSGQLGELPFPVDIIGNIDPASTSPLVPLGAKAVGIAAGREHNCAVIEPGGVSCWGTGVSGGTGVVLAPVPMTVGATVVSLSAGAGNTCALLRSGAVRCWGNFSDLLSSASFGSGYGNGVVYGRDQPVELAGDLPLL